MNNETKKIYDLISGYLCEFEEHKNKKIEYILQNSNDGHTRVLADDGISEAIEFDSKYNNGFTYVPEWDYNFDYYLFDLLENGYEIKFMEQDIHYSLWNSIDELYPNDIENKKGVNNYIKYCKDNNITKEYLDKEFNYDVPNIMNMFKDEKNKKSKDYER